MRKTVKIQMALPVLIVMLGVFISCAPLANIRPPSFANAIEGFDELGVSVESMVYIGIPNNVYFDLRVTEENTSSEHFIPILESISEYLRSEQFITYFEHFSKRIKKDRQPDYQNLKIVVQFLMPIAEESLWFESTPNTNFTEWWLGLEQVLPRD